MNTMFCVPSKNDKKIYIPFFFALRAVENYSEDIHDNVITRTWKWKTFKTS